MWSLVLLALVAAPKAGPKLAIGDACVLDKPVETSAKAAGKGPKTRLAKGASLRVRAIKGPWAEVESAGQVGFARLPQLNKLCARVAEPAAAPDVPPTPDVPAAPTTPVETPPTETPPASTTPPGAPLTSPATENPPAMPLQPTTAPAPAPIAPVTPASAAPPKDARLRVAVPDLRAERGLDAGLVNLLNEVVLSEFAAVPNVEAFGSSDLKAMMEHQETSQLFGCDNESCLAEIGGALGVDYLAVGNIGRVGSKFLVNLKLVNVRAARVESRFSQTVAAEEDALLDSIRTGAGRLVSDWAKSRGIELRPSGKSTAKTSLPPGATPPAAAGENREAEPAAAVTSGDGSAGEAPLWPAITSLALGAAAAGGGVLLGVLAQSSTRSRDDSTTLADYQRLDAAARGQALGATISFGAAGGLGALALGLGLWALLDDTPPAVVVSPVGGDSTGLFFAGAF